MKFLCILLGMAVAGLSGVLTFAITSGQFSLLPAAPELVEETDEQVKEEPRPLISPQIGLADELLTSLKAANEEQSTATLQLEKREKDVEELYSTYLKLRKEIKMLIGELESGLVTAGEGESKNFKKLAGVYSQMSSTSAAQSLKHMDTERAARVLTSMDSRAMASIMDETVTSSAEGSELVAQWSEAIRLLGAGKE